MDTNSISHIYNSINLFNVYLVVVILLVISLIYHTFIYEEECEEIEKDTQKITKKAKEKKYIDYVNMAHTGLIRGFIFGIILSDDGVETGIKNAAIYGLANPLFLHFGH
jgi:Ca2+/Na+ antiporter